MFSQLFHAVPREEKKNASSTLVPNQRSTLGESVNILPCLLSGDNDNLFFSRIPSVGALAEDNERMEKY